MRKSCFGLLTYRADDPKMAAVRHLGFSKIALHLFPLYHKITIIADPSVPIINSHYKRSISYSANRFFTARRHASAVYAVVVYLSVSLSVCLSITSRSSTETAIVHITQTTPHDSMQGLQFPDAKDLALQNSNGVIPTESRKLIALSVHLHLQHVCRDS